MNPSCDGHVWRPEGEVIFSLVDGHVYASWPGSVGSVRLGSYEAVTAMMEDFLAQSALGRRLSRGDISAP